MSVCREYLCQEQRECVCEFDSIADLHLERTVLMDGNLINFGGKAVEVWNPEASVVISDSPEFADSQIRMFNFNDEMKKLDREMAEQMRHFTISRFREERNHRCKHTATARFNIACADCRASGITK